MSVFLLDANVLIALAWPDHASHRRALNWFARKSRNGWATCPVTQSAFVRILSNPAFSMKALSPQNAMAALEMNLKLPGHHFWHDSVSMGEVFQLLGKCVIGHRQITDAYLFALAVHHRGVLATMDESIPTLGDGNSVELIPM